MKTLRVTSLFPLICALSAVFLFPALPGRAADELFITEFMAENDGTLVDEDGDAEDWIEIFNASPATVDLNGWYLTDNSGNLKKWRFPATNLTAGSYMIVFASNKDRKQPGQPLHTNFRLENGGEFLALVKPDGLTVPSFYSPTYPVQVADISYGIAQSFTSSLLVSNGSPGKLTVPVNGTLGTSWTEPAFNDGGWGNVVNGVGFEGEPLVTANPAVVADSVLDFSGNQGGNGWFYGYWNKGADANGTYEAADFTAFPRGTGNVLSSTNYWDGSRWDWPAGNPPWTELSSTGGHPSAQNGNAALPIHWVIRRYVSETNGPLRITGTLACSSSLGTCGDGTVARVLVNGVEVFQRSLNYLSTGYSIVVNASQGDNIDFVIDPGVGNNDSCDATTFTATVRTSGGASVVADSMADWSASGIQGENGWIYGYFNRTTGGTYTASKFVTFPSSGGPYSSANFWTGDAWQWFDGNPPFDRIGQVEMMPNIFPTGGANGQEHLVIRRWVSEVAGTIHVDWHLAKKDLAGGGVIGYVYQNGTQRDTFTLTGLDFAGTNRTITIANVQVGDFIDFAISPGADVQDDLTFLNATVHGSGTLANRFTSNVGTLMTNINSSAYLRIPFTVSEVSQVTGLGLRMKYDDGFVAYLNGVLVASAQAPEPPEWNSAATGARADVDAVQFQSFDLNSFKDLLTAGNNVLAIHGLNASAADQDFLIEAELVASKGQLSVATRRYFPLPTPGSANGVGTTNLGPLITRPLHSPAEPADGEDLVVTARLSPTVSPVAGMNLIYRVMYGAETSVAMVDDGTHGDGIAGDGVYGASIPQSAYTQGQMIRYYFTATDTANNFTRLPPLGDTNNASLYFGTVAKDITLTNPLPVLHWFIPPTAGSTLDGGSAAARCSLYWKGEFYDNVRFTRHGQSSTGFRKKSYNVDFNPDHHFLWADGEKRVDDINLLNTYPDKAHMRNMLSYGIHKDAGRNSPYHFVVPVRMQSNAVFYGTAHIVENGDDNYLKRIGRDDNGALYKMYDTMSATGPNEKKTRRYEDKSDLQELISRSATGNPTNRNWIYDNVDVSETINFLAAMIITANVDCCHKNYYVYRDTEGDGEWEMLPWDVDLSFGRNWSSAQSYWDDAVYPNNGLFVGGNATLPAALFASGTTTRAMYLRRVRSLQDQLLQTNGTPVASLNFERQADAWAEVLTPDALMDLEKWGTWGGGAQNLFPGSATYNQYVRNLPQSVAELKTNYLVNRRKYVFDQKMGNASEFPDAQPATVNILIGAIDYNPSSRNQDQEYIQLINTNNIAVDISGWTLSGAIEHTFQGGVVIPRAGSSNTLYVVANKKAFRNRSTAPKGGMGLYVEGPYKGQLSARGESIMLSNNLGRLIVATNYPGAPSPAQNYLRVTEIMYHPPRTSENNAEDVEQYEYIELKNIGPSTLDLTGIRFVAGIEFNFTGSGVTSLNPGEHVLVVRNAAAFVSRYGGGLRVAGQYTGALDNSGENIQLNDAFGEKILDFDYNNSWYPVTDGPGASLVIINENADWHTWNVKESWRPSFRDFGSPSQPDPTPAAIVPVLVNEILTHTDLPVVDEIELQNPNGSAADIGGWFLSDDFSFPKKYRIPAGRTIAPGGFTTFTETEFNAAGLAHPFSLSSKGDEVFLFSGDGTNLTGFYHGYSFDGALNGVSFGRYTNSQTNVHFVAQISTTLGAPNLGPKVGPVVISEINYRPIDLPGEVDNNIDEYIEIANISTASVALFNSTNTWRIRGGVDFDFPPGITLAPNAYALIVSFHPGDNALLNAFRGRYNVPNGVPIFGPFSGQLANDSDAIRLVRPDAADAEGVPQVLADEVEYASQWPWPTAADGIGPSLQKLLVAAYGNDPTNWTGVGPSPGAAYVAGGTLPVVTAQPQNTIGVVGRTVSLSVTVSGSAPLFYQWRFNGKSIYGANNSLLVLNQLQPSQAGSYSCIIFNSAGSTETVPVQLSVVFPPRFTLNPTNVALYVKPEPTAAPTTNATFYAAASGTPPMRYQWRFNGEPILNATNTSHTVVGVTTNDFGEYSCAVTDQVDTEISTGAMLFPMVRPAFVFQPVSQAVAPGAPVTLSAEITGFPPPFTYSWRLGSVNVATNVSDATVNFFTVTAPPTPNTTNRFRVVVSNRANPQPGLASAFAEVAAIVDTDGDGIPDSVEDATAGLDKNNPNDATADADGDGMKNAGELLAGTDPNDPSSYLKVEESLSPGVVTLTIATKANRSYTVQFSDDLVTWNNLADLAGRASDQVRSVTDSSAEPNRYYRLVLPAQP